MVCPSGLSVNHCYTLCSFGSTMKSLATLTPPISPHDRPGRMASMQSCNGDAEDAE